MDVMETTGLNEIQVVDAIHPSLDDQLDRFFHELHDEPRRPVVTRAEPDAGDRSRARQRPRDAASDARPDGQVEVQPPQPIAAAQLREEPRNLTARSDQSANSGCRFLPKIHASPMLITYSRHIGPASSS